MVSQPTEPQPSELKTEQIGESTPASADVPTAPSASVMPQPHPAPDLLRSEARSPAPNANPSDPKVTRMLSESTGSHPVEPKTEHIGQGASVNAGVSTAPLRGPVMPPAQPMFDISRREILSAEAKANPSPKPVEEDRDPQRKADRSLMDDDILVAEEVELKSPQKAELKPLDANHLPDNDGSHGATSPERNQRVGSKILSAGKLDDMASLRAEANRPTHLLQLPLGPFAVDVKPDYLRDFIMLVPGLVSIIVTVIIALLANQINKQQAESLATQSQAAQEQSKAAQEEVNVRFIEEFKKHLGDLTLPEGDEENPTKKENLTKKTLAAITLAQYGQRALPALKMSLNVQDKNIREGAAVVITQMLLDRSLRATVLAKLGEYFEEPNSALRVGVLTCYVTINRNLADAEFKEVSSRITKYVDPTADYTDNPDKKDVLTWAVKFFSNWPRVESKDFLLSVVQNSNAGDDPREGAINNIADIAMCAQGLSESQREGFRQEVSTALDALLSQASERLRKNITDSLARLQKPREMQCS